MSIDLNLRHWSSHSGARTAAEWCPATDSSTVAGLALARLVPSTADDAFLIVPFRSIAVLDVSTAARAYRRAGGTARICVAGRRSDLAKIDLSDLDTDHVGLMLDDVDTHTPLDDLIWDGIEAARFKDDFVLKASRNLRLGCALESMLGLACELGLCTLGTTVQPGGGCVSDTGAFDYLPASATPLFRTAQIATVREAGAAFSR